MEAAIAEGINFFDTANVYGRHLGVGASERIIGDWFGKGGGRREKVVLATKVYGQMAEWPNESRLSKLAIRRACEGSLRRLQTDYIDLYQMHHIDRDAWWNEIWEAMDQLKTEGKVLYVGSSNFAGWHIARANEIASKWHTVGLATEQSPYNLARRLIEMEVIPAVQEYGMGLIPYSPLAGGLLAGALKKVDEGRRSSEYLQDEIDKDRDRLERWGEGLYGPRRASRRCGARVAPPPAGGHRADHRPEDRGAARGIVPRARGPVGRRHPRAAGRDLPRPGRAGARGVAW